MLLNGVLSNLFLLLLTLSTTLDRLARRLALFAKPFTINTATIATYTPHGCSSPKLAETLPLDDQQFDPAD